MPPSAAPAPHLCMHAALRQSPWLAIHTCSICSSAVFTTPTTAACSADSATLRSASVLKHVRDLPRVRWSANGANSWPVLQDLQLSGNYLSVRARAVSHGPFFSRPPCSLQQQS